MFSCMKYLMASLSLLTFGWAAELTPVGSAEELIDGHGNSAGFISAAAIAEISPEVAERASSTEYATLDTVFERVIGLGNMCMTKKQINQFFNPSSSDDRNTKKGHADLFDWVAISDYKLFAQLLSNQLNDFFKSPDDFELKNTLSRGVNIIDAKYKMYWPHLLEHGDIWSPEKHGELTTEKFRTIYPQIKQKLDYLKEKFIQAKDKKTLYVFTVIRQDLETLVHLRNSLVEIRNGNKQFILLCIPHKQTFESFENIFVREAQHLDRVALWERGDPVRWGEILSEFKFTPDIWA